MKIFLICVLLFLLLIAAVLLLAVLKKLHLCVGFDRKFEISLKYFGFKINIYPPKKGKKKARQEKKEENERDPDEQDDGQANDYAAILTDKDTIAAAKAFLSQIEISKFRLNAKIALSDPYRTAMMYGGIAALTGIAAPAVCGRLKIRDSNINICADFEKNIPDISFYCVISTRLIYFLVFAYKIFKTAKSIKRERIEIK